MTSVRLIVAIRNIQELRGFDRIEWFLYSLYRQKYPCRVSVADGSDNEQHEALKRFIEKLPFETTFLTLHHVPMDVFNKPILINSAAKACDDEYLIFSDIDYVFHRLAIETGMRYASPDRLVLCKVKMLPQKFTMTQQRIDQWRMGKHKYNGGGDTACGAFQLHHRSFFEQSGGLDERMQGMCGMDESFVRRAKMSGKEIRWIEDHTEILHQWHRPAKSFVRPSLDMQRNWRLKDNIKQIDWRKE